MKITKEKMREWKAKYGAVYELTVDGYTCYLKPPDRTILSLSMSFELKDPLKADEVLLTNCWIEGDECIKKDLNLFLSIRADLAALFELKKSKLVKH